MPRARGLGPQGRRAVSSAAQTLSAAPVKPTNPSPQETTPAVVQSQLPESQTLPPPEDFVSFDSSRVAQAAYDYGSGRLYVLFHKPFGPGTMWTYNGIQPNVWRDMVRAPSVGKFINSTINPITTGHRGQWGI